MTPNRTQQKLIKNKTAKKITRVSTGLLIWLDNYKVYQISNLIDWFWEQSWLLTVIDQYVHRSIQNKVTMHQTQSVVTTATGHAGQRMAGCSRWQQGQPTQAINRHSNPNTGQPINLQQCERKGGSGLYRSLGNHCHSDGVLVNYDWTEGSWVR